MSQQKTHQAIIQSRGSSSSTLLPLAISTKPLPGIESPYHVLVRVLAVGLNPTDYKMITNFYMENNTVGCDFCGIVVEAGTKSTIPVGIRVIGADFPYRPNNPLNGGFAEYAVCDSRQTVRVPDTWSDTQAAALGAIGFGTACLAISDPDALDLKGVPSKPVEKPIPVLVYGGATATGLVAIQMLKQSGYDPVAVCSAKSAAMVMERGAVGTADYNSKSCVQDIKKAAKGAAIKHALDCITEPDSVEICFNALTRVGGRYACLEACPEVWRPKRAVKVKVVMGFESRGVDVDLGNPIYARKANERLFKMACGWTTEMQTLLDNRKITTQAYREVQGGLEAVLQAMEILRSGQVKGQKLVVRIGDL